MNETGFFSAMLITDVSFPPILASLPPSPQTLQSIRRNRGGRMPIAGANRSAGI